ncbi:homoserine dehydrogenase, partial [Bacillus sp. JR_15]
IKGHDDLAEIVIVTHHTSEEDFTDILQKLNDLEVVHQVKSTYRVEGNGWS